VICSSNGRPKIFPDGGHVILANPAASWQSSAHVAAESIQPQALEVLTGHLV
jgi:hypothetical protein